MMNEKQYKCMLNWIQSNKIICNVIIKLSLYLPIILGVIYICTLIYLWSIKSKIVWEIILICILAFITTSLLRKIINAPRPFDVYNIHPLITHTSYQSMPSRHATSAFIIAISCLKVNLYLGIICFCIAIMIACTRILCGVHFIKDIVYGILISILWGLPLILLSYT